MIALPGRTQPKLEVALMMGSDRHRNVDLFARSVRRSNEVLGILSAVSMTLKRADSVAAHAEAVLLYPAGTTGIQSHQVVVDWLAEGRLFRRRAEFG